MLDRTKRNTLKTLGALTAGAMSPKVMGLTGSNSSHQMVANHDTLASFTVDIGHSVFNNDIAVVLTNTGQSAATITQLTPARIETARGYFDFTTVIKNGAVTVEPGGSVRIGLTTNRFTGLSTIHSSGQTGLTALSVKDALRKQLTIVTESEAYAALTVIPESGQISTIA